MKKIFIVLLAILIKSQCAIASDETYKNGKVSVNIKTSVLPQEFRSNSSLSSSYFLGVNSLIVDLQIYVGQKKIAVPLEAFFGLTDPRSAEIISERSEKWVFELMGGDGVSAYRALIFFDRRHVSSVAIYSPSKSKSPYVVKKFSNPEVVQ